MKNQLSITPLENADINEAAKLCASAFITTPFTSTVMGGQSAKNEKKLIMGMKMMLKGPGDVFVAKDGEQIVGVIRMVRWPDCQKSTPSGLFAFLGKIFAGQGFRNMLHFRSIWAKHDPSQPHWHFDPLCVLPGRQGQGIGSQLMAYCCAKIDQEGMLAYLETDQEQNVVLYERFGFKTKESEDIFGIKNYFMWRENREASNN